MGKLAPRSSKANLPELPTSVRSRDGQLVDLSSDGWLVHSLLARPSIYAFDKFVYLTPDLVRRLKFGLLFHLQENSYAHFRNLYHRFLTLYRAVIAPASQIIDRIGLQHVLAYRASLDRKTEWKIGALRGLLVGMHERGYGVTASDALDYLQDATFRGNIKGTSVRTRDPNEGAFNDTELLSIQTALNDSYASGEIELCDYATAWVLLAYGTRPIQVVALKECDLAVAADDSSKIYALRMPRAKQRGSGIRSEFKTRYCSKQLGQLLEAVIADNAKRFGHIDLGEADRPLFWSDSPGSLPDLQYHMASTTLGRRVSAIVGRLTGLKANAKRFRITLAQRAADDGKDQYTLAELLDHSDTQNVGVYYEASPAAALRLDRHLAMEMAPLAQAFAGVIVHTKADAQRRGGYPNRIYDRSLANNVDAALGSCGQMSFCGLAVPFACYTCRHFLPWIDAPHEQFLDALIEDRSRMAAENYSPKIYTIRDRTIMAVAEVIQLCTDLPEEAEGP